MLNNDWYDGKLVSRANFLSERMLLIQLTISVVSKVRIRVHSRDTRRRDRMVRRRRGNVPYDGYVYNPIDASLMRSDGIAGDAIGPNGNIGQRHISQEPMSIILNLGISTSWTWIDWEKLKSGSDMPIESG